MGLVAGCGTQVGRAPGAAAANEAQPATGPAPLELSQYEPRSMLHVHESRGERSKFPSIGLPYSHLRLDQIRRGSGTLPGP
jgi:hypothetical protein